MKIMLTHYNDEMVAEVKQPMKKKKMFIYIALKLIEIP